MASSVERFDQIRKEWGLRSADESGARARREAVTALETWLAQAEQQPERLLRTVQTLLLNPENPQASTRAAVQVMAEAIQETWVNFGGDDPARDLQFLQAMILAVWPEKQSRVLGLACLLDTPFDLLKGRNHQQKHIRAWQNTRGGLPQDNAAPSSLPPWKQPTLPAFPSLTAIQRVAQPLAVTSNGLAETRSFYDRNGNHLSFELVTATVIANLFGQLNAIQEFDFKQLLEYITKNHDTSKNYTEDLTRTLFNELQKSRNELATLQASQPPPPELSLLWWGQARYSYRAEQSFRSLKNPELVLLVAAEEVAERSRSLPPEPACAFLQETLHALGQDLEEERTLEDWCRTLYQALQLEPSYNTDVEKSLADLLKVDALGLPICWLRLQARQHRSEAKVLEALSDACQVPLEHRLSRSQWSRWVFHEFLLDYHWTALFPEQSK